MQALLQEKWHRNQVELALWRYFLFYQDWGKPKGRSVDVVPQRFKSSVRKLLMLDRQLESEPGLEPHKWVFFESEGKGSGTEERFSDFHVFLLGFAIDVWKVAGWKQSEVIFFLRHCKGYFFKHYQFLRQANLPLRVTGGKRNQFGFDPEQDAQRFGEHIADAACFVLLTRDFAEIHNAVKQPGSYGPDDRVLFKPEFIYGCEALGEHLHKHANSLRTLILVEICDMARSLNDLLEPIEPKRKGRPKA